MKKIGIITIYDNNNYGNKLQNYATKEIIKSFNKFEVTTIKNKDRNLYIFENPKSVTNTYDDNIFEQCQLIIENIEKVLNKNNIKTEAIYYCCFELLVACLNTFCKIYSKKDAYDILKKYYKKYNKYLKNAENKYLNPKWKIVNTLLKMKFFKTIIFIYSIK